MSQSFVVLRARKGPALTSSQRYDFVIACVIAVWCFSPSSILRESFVVVCLRPSRVPDVRLATADSSCSGYMYSTLGDPTRSNLTRTAFGHRLVSSIGLQLRSLPYFGARIHFEASPSRVCIVSVCESFRRALRVVQVRVHRTLGTVVIWSCRHSVWARLEIPVVLRNLVVYSALK